MRKIPSGWCITGLHDRENDDGDLIRGACPIATGSFGPCPCKCHNGATEARGFIETAAAEPLISEQIFKD